MPDTHAAMRARDDRDGYGKAPMSQDATCQRPYPPVATLCAMFDHAVATAPDKVALRHLDVALTYREMGRAVAALAERVAAMVAPGEVVALVLPNSIDFHVAYFAALKALTTPALLNPSYPAAQLSPLLLEANARAVLCSPATREMVAGLANDLSIPGVVCLGQETIRDLVARLRHPSSCGPPRPRTLERCCSAAAPLDFPRLLSTRRLDRIRSSMFWSFSSPNSSSTSCLI